MSCLDDTTLKWLIEQSHNDYLTWIAIWLACMLGMVTILTTIASRPDILIAFTHKILASLMYWGLVLGTIFSVVRLTNIVKLGVTWMNQIGEKALKKQLSSTRGSLSKFIVRKDATICKFNLSLTVIAHVGVALLFFFLAL